jgi:dienelactone hydrolase
MRLRVPRRRGAPRASHTSLALGLLLLLAPALALEGQEKRALDHDDYDRWNRIQQESLSPDGNWLQYRVVPGFGDATLVVRTVNGERTLEIERGGGARFTRDSRYLVFRIDPTQAARDEARENRNTPAPLDSLGVLDLSTGEITRTDRIRGFTLPSESTAWVLVQREAERERREETPAEPAPDPAAEPEEEAGEEEEAGPRRDRPAGHPLHYRNLVTGEERVFPGVTAFQVTDDGTRVVFAQTARNGRDDGVYLAQAGTEVVRPLLSGEGLYLRLTLDREQGQVAFLSNTESWANDDPEHALYLASLSGSDAARKVAGTGSAGIPEGWLVSDNATVNFSHSGERLFFGTMPRPEPEPEGKDPMLEAVTVDIWSWHDDFLQPHQLQALNQERRRTYEAVAHLGSGRIVQLEDPTLLSVSVANRRDAGVALGQDELPYRQRVSWDTRFVDLYLVDVNTGARELLAEDIRNGGSMSPTGRYVTWWDGVALGWMVMDLETRTVVNATARVPVPVHNELDDRPGPKGSAGTAGWTEGDGHLVVHDAHDLWLVDPRGQEAPRNLTQGYGRANDMRLRIVRLGWEDPAIPLDEEIMLSAFHRRTKADGYYRVRFDRSEPPRRVVLEDRSFSTPQKAEDADVFLFTQRTFQDFPDLWVSNLDFGDRRRMSDANPQQAEINWGTAELMEWTSADGELLQGILYKPENFDASREWPMMVYFYERSSDGLHGYTIPGTGTSINRSFYVSRGYLLFVPDIPYKEGYPGESAMNAIIPGITAIADRGFVDRARIGVQGHSWGGYQIAYMVTRTNIFAAAEAGAPVTNMTSAYGGIRWESGRVRQMQYETGQSRIGGTLWDAQHRYIENSPLFSAYKVETPLLMLHNDRDGAVPWEEGIQFFVALRRLGKPVWLVNYNGQGHGVSGRYPQLDWTIRMQQFFDHYLKDAPPPVWLVNGVPALAKGRTLGLDLVGAPAVVDQGGGGGGD